MHFSDYLHFLLIGLQKILADDFFPEWFLRFDNCVTQKDPANGSDDCVGHRFVSIDRYGVMLMDYYIEAICRIIVDIHNLIAWLCACGDNRFSSLLVQLADGFFQFAAVSTA